MQESLYRITKGKHAGVVLEPRPLLHPDDPAADVLLECRNKQLTFWGHVFGDRSGIELLPGAVA